MADIKVPELGESIVEATVGNWLKQVGDAVSAGDAVVELETDKVNVEVIAEADGVIESITKNAGDTVSVGEALGTIAAGGSAKPQETAPKEEKKEAPKAKVEEPAPSGPPSASVSKVPAAGPQVRATPAVRRAALEHGVDLNQVQDRVGEGRIELHDILAHKDGKSPSASPAPKAVEQPKAAAPASGRDEERVRMSRRRITIAKRLVEAQHTAAMLTTFNEVDMSTVMDVRKRRKDAFKERHGVNLGFMSFFTKAVVGALKAFPLLNAEIQGDDMIVKRFYDIGVAVSAEGGLVVPVIRNADRKSFADIEREIGEKAKRARDNKLSLEELQGGTFTITNGGVFGSLFSTPILNAPQVAILGMHTIKPRPVAVNGQVEIRPMMYIALSYDHRIVDGAEAVSFLAKIKEMIEDPESLLLEG